MPLRILAGLFLATAIATAASAQPASVAGDWQVTFRQSGNTFYDLLHLDLDGDKLTGSVAGLQFQTVFRNASFEADLRRGAGPPVGKINGVLRGEELSGVESDRDGEFTFFARRSVLPPASGPRTHVFRPSRFHIYFTSKVEPALRVFPGDTVETTSVDAAGIDEKNARRTSGGNPLTGPFYVEGAWPGDTLAVKLNWVRLNREKANGGTQLVPRALAPSYYRGLKFDDSFSSEWILDREKGVARLAKPSEHLKNYTVPLKPMLGCIGVAPALEQSYRSSFLGGWGGNMDYNQFGEGVTLYFPVLHPGALLFLGDGHAAQGDGELTGAGLETSMEFSFTVELLKGKRPPAPRAENAQYFMASGIANSLPEALQEATTNLARWLSEDFKLTSNEVAVVLGTAIRFDVAEVVDPLVHVVAKIEKRTLALLQP
jgi:acetamidase/formamidase